MIACRLCNATHGEGNKTEYCICVKCYPIIAPLVDVRVQQLARLQARREKATADNINLQSDG